MFQVSAAADFPVCHQTGKPCKKLSTLLATSETKLVAKTETNGRGKYGRDEREAKLHC